MLVRSSPHFEKAPLLFPALPLSPYSPASTMLPALPPLSIARARAAAASSRVRKAALRQSSALRAARKVAATFTWTFEAARGRRETFRGMIKAEVKRGEAAMRTKAKTEEVEEDSRLPWTDLSFFEQDHFPAKEAARKARESRREFFLSFPPDHRAAFHPQLEMLRIRFIWSRIRNR